MKIDRIGSVLRMGRETHDFTLSLADRLRVLEQKVAALERTVYGVCDKCGQDKKQA